MCTDGSEQTPRPFPSQQMTAGTTIIEIAVPAVGSNGDSLERTVQGNFGGWAILLTDPRGAARNVYKASLHFFRDLGR